MTIKRTIIASVLFVFIAFNNQFIYATVPNEIAYQGRIREYNQLITGSKDIEIAIFSQETGGSAVYTQTFNNTAVVNGIFNVMLSPTVDWRNGNHWLQTTISGKILSPRTLITSDFYALHAKTAEGISVLDGDEITLTIGSSPVVKVAGNQLQVVGSGGIKFPDNTVMTSAGTGSATAIANAGDAVVMADANGDGSGDIAFKINNLQKMTLKNSTGDLATAGRVKDKTGFIMPVGTVISYAGDTIPDGWLECDGRLFTAGQENNKYRDLFDAIGTSWGGSGESFNIPDLRGMFLRGIDGTAGRDPDRDTRTAQTGGGHDGNNVGSKQGHATRKEYIYNHAPGNVVSMMTITTEQGSIAPPGPGFNGAWVAYKTTGSGNATAVHPGGMGQVGLIYSGSGNETRPINAYVKYIVKY